MKKIVTVTAVCLACIFMAGLDVQATATSATTDENIVESTELEEKKEEQPDIQYLYEIEKISDKDSSTSVSGNNKAKSKGEKSKATGNKTKSKSKSKKSKSKTVSDKAKSNKTKSKGKNKTTKIASVKSELSEGIAVDSNLADVGRLQEAAINDNIAINSDDISAVAVSEKKKQVEKNKKNKYTPAELKYMTCIIYCEARGEEYAGQMAVGIVVMNRVKSEDFPDTIKKVIYQRGQFTPTVNGSMSRALSLYEKYDDNGKFKGEMVSCYKAAKEVLSGTTTVKVDGEEKEMKKYLYFSRYIRGAKYTLGSHQFK